jgi:hypothetical protein
MGLCRLAPTNGRICKKKKPMTKELNVKGMFIALEQLGVHHIDIAYSGGGDSGAIDEIRFYDKDKDAIEVDSNIDQIVNDLGYHILDKHYDVDWYNNEGGFGTIEINIPDQNWTIDGYINVQTSEEAFESGSLTDVIEAYTKD